jgi:hypothetical protein
MVTRAEIEEAKQAAKDAKDAPITEKAYNKSLRNTEPAENKSNFGGKTGIEGAAMEKAASDDYKKFGSVQRPEDDQRQQGAIQAASRAARSEIKRETKGMAPKAYAKGGSVSPASKRADGIAQRGKTRGMMC